MVIVEVATGQKLPVAISPVESKDFQKITKRRYFFDWAKERGVNSIFKLTAAGQSDILGLVSVMDFPGEHRLQLCLLCASRENIGKTRKHEGIVGCLIAFVGILALEKYFGRACISLLAKTELRPHYKRKYGMLDGGPQLFLEGSRLLAV
ncbi:MAG TPA: hypothetical protein VGM89_14075, partial [Puia sp.]